MLFPPGPSLALPLASMRNLSVLPVANLKAPDSLNQTPAEGVLSKNRVSPSVAPDPEEELVKCMLAVAVVGSWT